MRIHVLSKFAPNPYGGIEIDTTSSSGEYQELSPFILSAIKYGSKNFENLWQYSKVYPEHINPLINPPRLPSSSWYEWRDKGWNRQRANRYPMGKGKKPEYSYWNGVKLSYVEARKKIYAPIYAELVKETDSFKILSRFYTAKETLILRDYDAYDHIKLGMSLKDVINNTNRKMGHAFVLAMILVGELDECIKS